MKVFALYQAQAQRILLTSALSFGLALSSYSVAHAQVRQDTNDQQVSYITGGVGQEELGELRQHAADYNAQFSFANATDRAYLNNLQIRILDAQVAPIFEDDDLAPLLYLHLKPGTYKLLATSNGVEKELRFTIREGSTFSDVLTW